MQGGCPQPLVLLQVASRVPWTRLARPLATKKTWGMSPSGAPRRRRSCGSGQNTECSGTIGGPERWLCSALKVTGQKGQSKSVQKGAVKVKEGASPVDLGGVPITSPTEEEVMRLRILDRG